MRSRARDGPHMTRRQERPSPGDLDSPFLREAPRASETEGPGRPWQGRLDSLETECPFLRPFQLSEDRELAVATDAFLEEAPDREAEGQTGSESATADAFVADADGKAYFTTFPQLGDLTIRKSTVLSPAHFESLVDHLLASDQKNFVIDAHGNPLGLHMPLASGTKISAVRRSLFMLTGIERIRTLMRLADESNTIWEHASGTDLDKWRRIVETMHSGTWHDMIGDPWPRDAPSVATVPAAKSLVRSRLSALVDALFPGGVSGKQGRVDRLIEKMLQLQAKGIREIQFRACNIGKDAVTLHEFRRFFGADHLCAPDVRSGMGPTSLAISRAAVDGLASRRLAQVYDLPSGRFAIRVEVSGVTFKATCAATTQAAVGEWVAAHLMAHSRYRTGTFPIHFLEIEPRVFALDPEYAARIKCRSSFWEGVVRAQELKEEADRSEEAIGAEREETSESALGERPGNIESEEEPEAEEGWARALEHEAIVAGHLEIEQETDGATLVRRLPALQMAIYEGGPASPFLGELLFVREQNEAPPPSADLIASELPFTTYELQREERAADTAKSQPVEKEQPGANEEPTAELYSGEREREDADREADDDPGRLLEFEQGITGEDDRVEVGDTTVAPYRWICSVTYEKGGQTLDGGSGVLISDRHVLTAGHVIREAGSGPDAPSLVIYPGRHYRGEPFGRYLAGKTRLPNFNMDFGLITLTRPVDPGVLWWGHPSTNTEWWSEAAIPLRQLRQIALLITTAGFPGAKDAYRRRMYEAKGETVPARFGGVFRHTADTTQGQSGSPVWTELQGRRILIGIVRAFDELPNQIAVFAHDGLMQRLLRQWMAQDAPRSPRVERRIALEIPYRWVCRLEVYDNDLRRTVGYGSGLLISNQHVLTLARVIHGFVQDRRRYAVSVAPGYEFGKEAFGSTTVSKGRTSPRFSPDSKDASAEFGLLTLSRALGTASFAAIKNAALGSWGGANYGIVSSAADWSGKPARMAAFSRSAGGGGAYQKLRVSSGGFVGLTSGQILHRAGSKLDAPGAPLWVEAGDRRLLVGIATTVFSKDSEVNWGCYLSEEAQSHLRQWMNEDFEGHETEAADRFSQDETEIFAAEGGAEPEPEGVEAADELDDLSDMERGRDLEVEHGMAGHAQAEWAMELADHEDESPLTSAGTVETVEDTRLEYDTPPMTQAISDAVDQKDWPRVLNLAMQVGWHDENRLTNLLFYSRHPELDRRKLDPKKNKDDRQLADEWNRILINEIRPAIHRAAEDSTLEVRGNLVAERDPQLSGEKGAKFKEVVAWAAKEVDIDPGFLAAVLLAEWDQASLYLSTGEVSSFKTGTDDFFVQRTQLRANVPAFKQVHFDERKKTTNINEHGRRVTTIPYKTGRDAALATAVYLKYGEIKLRRAALKNGGDFDTLPVATRFVLVRLAMAAGHGGISPDGDLVRFKKKGAQLVRARPGETDAILLGVARSLDRVLKGEDILVRNWEPRKDPTNDSHITHRNATILASQAMHLGDWFFRAQPLGIQPELEEGGPDLEQDAADDEAVDVELEDEVVFGAERDDDESAPFEALVSDVSLSDLRTRIDAYCDLANAEYTLPHDKKVKALPQFRYATAGGTEAAIVGLHKILGAGFEKSHPRAIRYAAYGRAKPSQIAAITQALIDAGELSAVSSDNPGLADTELVRKLQRKFKIGIDCAGYVQLAFVYAFLGHDNDTPAVRRKLGLHERRGYERLSDLPARHFDKVTVTEARTGDLIVLKPRAGDADRAWHTVIVVDHTVAKSVHTYLVDASWGTDLYGELAGGVARRQLVHDTDTGKWWDISPVDVPLDLTPCGIRGVKKGEKACENAVGPYAGHSIKGVYRAKQK